MNVKTTATLLIAGGLMLPAVGFSADVDTDRSHPSAYVKDSVVTAKIKAKLAKDKMTSATHIKVDTDNSGAVMLSGTAKSKAEAEKAIAIARETEGVKDVQSTIQVKAEQ